MGNGVDSDVNLAALEAAIAARRAASPPTVRRSFARMRTEDPAREAAPVVSNTPTRRLPRMRTGG